MLGNIIFKNVRSKDNQDIGYIINEDVDNITISSIGARHNYKVPKSKLEGFNGSEVLLNITYAELYNYET